MLVAGVLLQALLASAHAQLLNQFVPAEIYGAGTEPDVTVASRLRPGYDNGGVRLGTVVLRPRLSELVGYESNVLGQKNAVGSALVESTGTLNAMTDNSRFGLTADAMVDDFRYTDLPRQSSTAWNARIGGNVNIGRDVASLIVSHNNYYQTQRDLDVPQLDAPLAIAVDALRASYRTILGRLTLLPNLEVSHYRYNSGITSGTVYDQGYRNRTVVAPSVVASYEFATRRSAIVVVRESIGSYSVGTATNPRRDFNDATVLGGIDYDLNGSLRARALAGYEVRTFQSAAYKTIQAPIAEFTLIYNPTGLTTITGTLSRRIQDSADETVAGVTSLVAQFRIDHELRRNVILTGTGSFIRNDYNSGGSQNSYQGGVSAAYLLNRYASVSALYDILVRSGSTSLNLGGVAAGGDFTDHRFLVQLKLSL